MRYNTKSDAHLARPAGQKRAEDVYASSNSPNQERPASLLGAPPSQMYPSISTERIMHAVECQRRISQQLEDLRAQQQERTAVLRRAGLRFMVGLSFSLVFLIIALVVLFFVRPDLLVLTLVLLSDTIALLLAVGESLKAELSLIPSNSWLFSGAALLVVLMTVLWLRLMRHPQEIQMGRGNGSRL